jgi:ADP-heptose:LPS heptosyltransferase
MIQHKREPRILITRLSAYGDCILTMPTACALRERFPRALLVWAAEPLALPTIQLHSCIDDVIPVPKRWLKSPRAIRRLRRQLRAWRFDLAIDPQSLTKSAALAWLSGAKRRIGFAAPRGREMAPWLNTELVTCPSQHVVDASLGLLRPLGIHAPAVRFDVPVDATSAETVGRYLEKSHLTSSYCVINAGASWISKLWPADRFGRVARFLGEVHHLPSVVTWAGDLESQRADVIVGKSGGHAVKSPDTSFLELAELARRATLVVSSDTGPLHLAAGTGTPCVGLYGPTRHEDCGPYGKQHIALQADFPSRGNRRQRKTNVAPMHSISEELVCRACSEILTRPAAHEAA